MRIALAEPRKFSQFMAQHYGWASAPEIGGVSIDSREVEPGDLYVPIIGANVDGHDFIDQAIAAGASAILAEKVLSIDLPVARCENSIKEIGKLANLWRKQFDAPVLAITGSNGKTTTKALIRDVLEQKFNVLATERSFNSTIGLPLTIFSIGHEHQIVIVELGSNQPGEIAYLSSIAEPTVGLVTNVSDTHLELLGSLEGVAREKGALFNALSKVGVAIVNLDDPIVAAMETSAKRFTYSLQGDADVRGQRLDKANTPQMIINDDFTLNIPQAGSKHAQNALAASAAGLFFGLSNREIKAGIESFTPPPGRGGILNYDGVTLIDDSYNANLASTLAGIQTMLNMPTKGRRIAVFGDMLELGHYSEEHHRRVGEFIATNGINELFCFGPATRATCCGALEKGLAARHYDDKASLASELAAMVHSGDLVYIKGSRSMAMETIIEEAFKG